VVVRVDQPRYHEVARRAELLDRGMAAAELDVRSDLENEPVALEERAVLDQVDVGVGVLEEVAPPDQRFRHRA